MKIRIRDIRVPLDYTEDQIIKRVAKKLNISVNDIKDLTYVRKAVDARRKEVLFSYTVDITINDCNKLTSDFADSNEISIVENEISKPIIPGSEVLPLSPVVIGSGPAGLFCALYLARYGYKPVIIERGEDVDRRVKSVERFWKDAVLNTNSNTQFGEGGAGTFSDGKLTTRSNDQRIRYILETFVKYGANEEILYLKKPHIGTDVIRDVVKKIRQEIIDLGGEVYFDSCLTDININKKSLKSIVINNKIEVDCSILVLAVGNSARDIYRLLYNKGIYVKPKAFAVGVRVEHPQELIDRIQYKEYANHPRLGAADYHLTYQDKETGRSLYTFCMCPGGYVIGAASEKEQVVTNGMSYFVRDTGVANSAIVVTVNPNDWNNTVLGGVKLQDELEHKAFLMGGGNYFAPAQYMKDFLLKTPTISLNDSIATFTPGVKPVNLWELFNPELCRVMVNGLKEWNKKMPGFIYDKAVLTGVETRTSAPLRIERDQDLTSVSLDNVYPCGEGAGYAGGIISAALDGLRVAEQIVKTYSKPQNIIRISHSSVTQGSLLKVCKWR